MERNDNLQNRSVVASIYKKYYLDLKQYLVSYTHDVMPAKRAAIYKMYKHEEMTTDEIVEKLQLSKRTVETHIYLSTKDMKSYLRKII